MLKKIFFIFFSFLVLLVVVLIMTPTDKIREFSYRSFISQHQIPEDYLELYNEAADKYDIPWELLASVHRVETIFSTMDPLVSPVGALGHFQFMPRTWVGWTYPGGSLGEIEDEVDITELSLIAEHGGYGVDGDGDGIADPFNIVDATHSAAKYLADHGAANGHYEEALFAYNQSQDYVDEVMKYFEQYMEEYELITLRHVYDY
ncbi:lytic transglycosylase domain-containing protein [Alkalihalobacillus sp. 1P02AB]|uniref:lytic transglycosylase domain-containing protein n=1 Tax=Alkalihalobacillus sp. 1P02AB TaxID=3132260 RepID=UPI0039A512C3